MKKKVLLALSGGIDSAVSAHLLKEAAYDVEAVFFRFHSLFQVAENSAKCLADYLSLPFRAIDARPRFQAIVETYFIDAYRRGLTPNPCAFCNANLKMKLLYEAAVAMDCDYLATGHYARICRGSSGTELWRGLDQSKDQSYFLSMVPSYILERTIFPLGEQKKSEVKAIAQELGLPVPAGESQDVCFVGGDLSVSDFLSAHLPDELGQIVDPVGSVLGQHRGLWRYTIGQRKGIELGGKGPYYVVGRDFSTNSLIVSADPSSSGSLYRNYFQAIGANFLCDWPDNSIRKCLVSVRYQHSALPCVARRQDDTLTVELPQALRAVAAGQLACFYDGERILAGAWLDENQALGA